MTDHENELVIGIGRDGKPVKVTFVNEDEDVARLWDKAKAGASTQSRHGKSNLAASLLAQELIRQGREN